jgi:hypothetical protein
MASPLHSTTSATATTETFKCPLVDASRLDVGFVARWYETLGDIGFIEAVAGSTSLIRGICNKHVSLEFFRPSQDNGAAGAVDFRTPPPRMFISKIFVSSALEMWPIGVRKFASIGACNGTIVHESLHVEHTRDAMPAIRALNGRQTDIFQIIEDLFIETECEVNFPALFPFITLKNAFLFSKMIDDTWERQNFGVRRTNVRAVISKALPIIKYFRRNGFIEYISRIADVSSEESRQIVAKVQDIANRAMVAGIKIETRIELAIELAALLQDGDPYTETAKENVYTLTNSSAMNCKLDKSFLKAATDGDEDEVDGETFDDDDDDDDDDGSGGDKLTSEEFDEARAALSALSMELRLASLGTMSSIIDSLPVFAINLPMHVSETSMEVPTTTLSRHLRQVQTPRTTVGEPRTSGRIASTRLWRIATDNKVFAEQMHIDRSARAYEFAIAVDASGSMGQTFFKQVLTTAAGIKMDINEGGFPAQLLAFSADTHLTEDGLNCAIYLIGGRERLQMIEMKRYLREAADIKLLENRDNLVIKWSSTNCFTDRRDTVKVLLVLSDGDPSAKMFRGTSAEATTKREIEEARRRGVIVIGVSIKKDVVASNEAMYGTQFHVDASNPTTIGEQIAKTINRIFES